MTGLAQSSLSGTYCSRLSRLDGGPDGGRQVTDNVPAIELKPTYDGYLDVVMHGDRAGTAAFVDGTEVEFSLSDTARLITESGVWDRRPIRLMSCSTGQGDFAQELADRINAPVYAPSDILEVRDDGSTFVHTPGAWRRFEPHPR